MSLSSLSMPSNLYFTFPYLIALLVVLVAVGVLLFVFRSLRDHRRKRNILVYAVVLSIVILLVFQIDNVSRRALIDFGISSNTSDGKAYRDQVNQVDLYSSNHGDRSADFFIILNGVNASFQLQNQQNYILLNSRSIKVAFSLSEPWFSKNAQSQSVFYTVDDNVTSFSFSTHIEPKGLGGLSVMNGLTSVTYVWNGTQDCYVMMYGSGFTV